MGLDQGKDLIELMFLAIDRIDQGLSSVDIKTGLQCLWEGRVNTEGYIRDFLYGQYGFLQHSWFVYARNPNVDIQYMSAPLHLPDRFRPDQVEISGLQ